MSKNETLQFHERNSYRWFLCFWFQFFDCGFDNFVIWLTFWISNLFLDFGQFPVLWSNENVVSFNPSIFFTDDPIGNADAACIWSSSRCTWCLPWLWSLCWSWWLSWFWGLWNCWFRWFNKSWLGSLGWFWDWSWNWLGGWSWNRLRSWSRNWFWSWNWCRFWSISLRHIIRIALAVTTNRDHIKFGHGHHSDLRVDIDTEIFCEDPMKINDYDKNLLASHDNLGWGNTNLGHLAILLVSRTIQKLLMGIERPVGPLWLPFLRSWMQRWSNWGS